MERLKSDRGPVYEYLQKTGLKQYKFAEHVGISKRTACILSSNGKVGAEIALRIESYTNGCVKAKDICYEPQKCVIQQEFKF